MSHDTDKLIRQLSLVAFLMAERRPLTARDVKGNVEGYSEMSDEAFARRFYSDRAELTALGVPLTSQRDEFTGEELYTLRSENYFLDRLDLEGRRARRPPDRALTTLEGKFAVRRAAAARAPEPRARPARLPARADRRPPSASGSPRPTTRPSSRAASRSSSRRSRSSARSSSATGRPPASARPSGRLNPYALRLDEGVWYVVGHDLDRDAIADVPRLADPQRHPLRDAARARLPAAGGVRRRGAPRRRGRGRSDRASAGRPDRSAGRHRLVGAPHAVRRGQVVGRRVRDVATASLEPLASLGPAPERPGRPARAARAPRRGRGRRCASSASGTRRASARARARAPGRARRRRPSDQPGRAGRARALRGSAGAARAPARGLRREPRRATSTPTTSPTRFSIPREELQETLSLLNLVNFGGGCYTVYAEVDDETRRRPRRQGAVRRRLPQGRRS